MTTSKSKIETAVTTKDHLIVQLCDIDVTFSSLMASKIEIEQGAFIMAM